MGHSPSHDGGDQSNIPCSLPGITVHARQKAIERYGQDFSEEAWFAAWLSIVEGRALLVRKQDTGNPCYAVIMPNMTAPIMVVYDRIHGKIVTTLPAEANRSPYRQKKKPRSMRSAAWRGAEDD